MDKIYQGGTQELREAMAEAFVSGDWSGWEIKDWNTDWVPMCDEDIEHINRDGFSFRRKRRTMTLNGVGRPTILRQDHERALHLWFSSTEECDQFEAVLREVMEGGK